MYLDSKAVTEKNKNESLNHCLFGSFQPLVMCLAEIFITRNDAAIAVYFQHRQFFCAKMFHSVFPH